MLALASLAPWAAADAPVACRGVAVSSTAELLAAISSHEPEVCLASGDYPLDAQLDLITSVNLSAVVPGGAQLDARGSKAEPRRVVRVRPGATVVLAGLVVRGGRAPRDPEFANYSLGGGIYNTGELTLEGCTVADSHAADVRRPRSNRRDSPAHRSLTPSRAMAVWRWGVQLGEHDAHRLDRHQQHRPLCALRRSPSHALVAMPALWLCLCSGVG